MESEKDTPSSAQPEQPTRSRRWPWVLLAIMLVLGIGAGIGWYQLGGKLTFSEPYKMVMDLVQKDSQVVAGLGQPIRRGWRPPSGWANEDNATLTFTIEGPKGRASVHAEGRRMAGKWGLQTVDVTITADGGNFKRISLNPSSGESGEGDAPKWPPAGSAPAPPPAAAAPKVPPPTSPGPEIQLDMPDLNAPADKKASEPKPAGK